MCLFAVPRAESFAAELHWIRPNVLEGTSAVSGRALADWEVPPPQRLAVRYIGNRQKQDDGNWQVMQNPPRSQDGTFHVTVSLARTGLHAVRIKGPSQDGLQPSEYLGWEVHVLGVCPAQMTPLLDPPWECGCAAGSQPSSQTESGMTMCRFCAIGQIKEASGNFQCGSCLDAIVHERGAFKYAAERTLTYRTGSSALHECGCSGGLYLSHIDHANATHALSVDCPHITSDSFAERMVEFQPFCCNATLSADCSDVREKLCQLSKCRAARLLALQDQRRHTPNISGVCSSCSVDPSGLLMEGVDCAGGMHSTERLPIRPGHWRANELSEEVKKCIVPSACIGNAQVRLALRGQTLNGDTGLLDSICGPNRFGPYCEVCFPSFYKDDAGNWCVRAPACRFARH